MSNRLHNLAPQQRAAHIALRLCGGERLRTCEVQRAYGFSTWESAYQCMNRIGGAIPLTQDEQRAWRLVSEIFV